MSTDLISKLLSFKDDTNATPTLSAFAFLSDDGLIHNDNCHPSSNSFPLTEAFKKENPVCPQSDNFFDVTLIGLKEENKVQLSLLLNELDLLNQTIKAENTIKALSFEEAIIGAREIIKLLSSTPEVYTRGAVFGFKVSLAHHTYSRIRDHILFNFEAEFIKSLRTGEGVIAAKADGGIQKATGDDAYVVDLLSEILYSYMDAGEGVLLLPTGAERYLPENQYIHLSGNLEDAEVETFTVVFNNWYDTTDDFEDSALKAYNATKALS